MDVPVEYCRAGFLSASATFDHNDLDVDVSGKSFMITGANSGIGKAVSMQIAKRGGTVHMLCLFPDEDTRKEIVDNTGNEGVYLHVLDLSQPKRVYQFAKQFADNHDSLDVLVNNAGCMMATRQLTADGLQMSFAINSLGPYILTTTLLPLLNQTPGSRVITVASSAIYYQKVDISDLQKERMEPYDMIMCYGQSKRQQVIMTEMWALAFPKIHFSAMHPGVAVTGMLKSSMPELYELSKTVPLRTPEQGADTVVWLGIADSAIHQASGQFYFDRKVASTHLPGRENTQCSNEEKQKLMENLEKIATDMK